MNPHQQQYEYLSKKMTTNKGFYYEYESFMLEYEMVSSNDCSILVARKNMFCYIMQFLNRKVQARVILDDSRNFYKHLIKPDELS